MSDKKSWVVKTLSALDSSFDKKKLLEQVDAFDDPELRSIIATSLTGSMAKRKLEGYAERMGAAPASASKSEPTVEKAASKKSVKKKSGKQSASKRSEPDEKPAAEAPASTPEPEPVAEKPASKESVKKGSVEQPTRTDPTPAPDSASVFDVSDLTADPEPARQQAVRDQAKPIGRSKPAPEPAPAPKPAPAPSMLSKLPSQGRDQPGMERFDRLEKTILTTKSNTDLSVPDLPTGMIDNIRQLKELAQHKATSKPASKEREKPSIVRSEPSHLRGSDEDLLGSLGTGTSETPQAEPASVPEPSSEPVSRPASVPKPSSEPVSQPASVPKPVAQPASIPKSSSEPVSQPASVPKPEPASEPDKAPEPMRPLDPTRSATGAASSDETLEPSRAASDADLAAFDDFFEHPAGSSSDEQAPDAQQSEPAIGPEPVPTPEPAPEPAPEPEQGPKPVATERPAAAQTRSTVNIDRISKQFEGLLSTMDEMNRSLPSEDGTLLDEDGSQSEPREPEQPAPKPESARESVPKSEPAPVSDPKPVVEAEPEAPPYDGSWINRCESLSDVLDALDSAEGSIEDLRSTVAFFVVGFSDELANMVRTAQSKDELELMLRRALTESIEDAFDRTEARFAEREQTFERQAERAAASYDEAVRRAAEEHAQPAPEPAPKRSPKPAPAPEPEVPEVSAKDLVERVREAYGMAEEKSADDLSKTPPPPPKPKTPTLAGRIAQLITTMHGEIESGDIDHALKHLAQARDLLGRQIELKSKRGEPVVDEKMADFELKSLGLDLEILKARG